MVVMILTFQLFLMLQWTKEDGHRTATSAVPNLFVPLNTNPKEVQEMRNKVRTDWVRAPWTPVCGRRWPRLDGALAAGRQRVLALPRAFAATILAAELRTLLLLLA